MSSENHLNTQTFDYPLDEQLIAKNPLAERTASKLMHLDAKGQVHHRSFSDIIDQINKNDLVVVNTTKVIKARLFGKKSTGGQIELLIERILDNNTQAWAHVKSNKRLRIGIKLHLGEHRCTITDRDSNGLCLLTLDDQSPIHQWSTLLDKEGHMPLPPYIDRTDTPEDLERYQSIFAQHAGAVAAPTASLHFDETLWQAIADKGIPIAEVLLHVGAGTFQPVRVETITDHPMHKESIEVNASCIDAINACKMRGGRVIAIGTTVARALETACQSGEAKPYQGDTQLFLYPGRPFYCIDCLVTNFHLPRSTLLMLVCAFSGTDAVLNAYKIATQEKYRFFSYGDAMFLEKENR